MVSILWEHWPEGLSSKLACNIKQIEGNQLTPIPLLKTIKSK